MPRGPALLLAIVVLAACKKDGKEPPTHPDARPAAITPSEWVAPQEVPPQQQLAPSWTPLLRLVPDADFVMGLDLDKVRQTEVWAETIGEVPKLFGSGASTGLEAFESCGVRLGDVRRVVFAAQFEQPDRTFVAADARGLGETSRLDCIAKAAGVGDALWDGRKLVMDGGKSQVFPLSGDVVVAVDQALAGEVEAALDSGRAEPHPSIANLLARTDLEGGAWMIGDAPPDLPAELAHVRRFTLGLDSSTGLRASLFAEVDPGHADAVRTFIESKLTEAKGLFSAIGVSADLFDTLQIRTVGGGVVIIVNATEADVRQVLRLGQQL